MNLHIALTDTRFCKYRDHAKIQKCFEKVVQLFNLMRDYFPIRDSKRLESVNKCFYQFFDALKIKDRKIRGNCNLLTKVKFLESE